MKKKLLLTFSAILLLIGGKNVKAQVSFAPAVNYGTIGPNSVFSADFNGDTNMDLATASNGNNVSVLLGSSSGTFAAAVNYTSAAIPRSIYSADFNGDGKMDLVTCAQGTSIVWVHLNNGNGTFAPGVYYSVASPNYSVFSADFNGDGKMDLVTANISSSNVSVLLGNGDGTFAGAIDYAVGTNPYSVFSADFNGDGKMDLVTANYNSNNVSVLLGSSTGTFAAAVNYVTGTNPQSVFSADFNGDGKMDLVTANYNSNNVSVLLGSGTGTFAAAVNFAVGTKPQSVFSADFNGDGKMDLVTANNTSNNISVLLGSGTGAFAAAVNFAVATGPASVFSADFNADGKMDLATANPNSSNVSVLLNNTPAAALNFDGTNDFVNIPNNSSLNFGTNDFTIETYAKTSSLSGNRVMIGKINGGNNFWFGVSNGKANFSLIGGPDALGTSTIGDGNWHHLAAVRQNGVVSLYVDGVLEASQNNTGTATINANLTLGNFSGGFNFPGSLDEVRIWNRALCKGELLNNKNAELPSSQTGLVAYYNFNQGLSATNNSTVTSLNDLSGNANNGTLNNFTLNGAASNWVAPGAVISGSTAPTYTALTTSVSSQVNVLCNGGNNGSATVTTTGGTSPYTYLASTGATVSTLSNLTAGAYTYTVTDNNGCAKTQVLTITEPSALVTNTTLINVLCFGNSTGAASVTASGGTTPYTYLWSGAQTTSVITGQTAGVKTVTVTDANACTSTATASITQPSLLAVNAVASSTSICANAVATITVSATGGTPSYLGTGTFTTNLTSSTYTVSDANSCAASQTVFITINSNPIITVNSGAICAGETFTMTPSGAVSYTYSSGTDVVTPTANDSYTVTGTDANGCENTAVSTVTVNPTPSITANSGNVIVCGDVSADFGIVASGSNNTYEWHYDQVGGSDHGIIDGSYTEINFDTDTMTIQQVLTGNYNNYYVYCYVTNEFGCFTRSVNDTIVANPTPTITVNSGTICAGQSFTMVPTGADTYSYSGGGDVVMPTTDATYTVTGTDVNGCENTAVSSVTVNTLPAVTVNSGAICAGQSFTMVPSGADTYTYSNASNVAMPTSDATYTITGTDALTGCENTAVSSVTVNSLPVLTALTNNTLLCVGQTATLSVSGASTYTWSTTENTSSVAVSPTVQTTYTVNGTDANGCENTTTVTQDVSACTGIATLTNDASVNVYPNPNKGMLVVELTTVSKVTIMNALGQVVITETFEVGKHIVNINNESTGVYFVKVMTNNKQQIIKVIKE